MKKNKVELLSILSLIISTFYCSNNNVFFISAFYIVQLFTVKYAKYIRNFFGSLIIRRSIYFVPQVIGIITLYNLETFYDFSTKGFFIALFALLFILSLNKKELILFFSSDYLVFKGFMPLKKVILEFYSSIMSAIVQEGFYKIMILIFLYANLPLWLSISCSSLLFVLEHYFHFASENLFDNKAYILQFILSFIGGILFIKYHSIFLPVIVHLLYNIIFSFSFLKQYLVNKNTVKV